MSDTRTDTLAWAVKGPDSPMRLESIRRTASDAWRSVETHLHDADWFEARGYTVVRVRISEVPNE